VFKTLSKQKEGIRVCEQAKNVIDVYASSGKKNLKLVFKKYKVEVSSLYNAELQNRVFIICIALCGDGFIDFIHHPQSKILASLHH
jgi:hypothetical protein